LHSLVESKRNIVDQGVKKDKFGYLWDDN
jgi:hypothetical protein